VIRCHETVSASGDPVPSLQRVDNNTPRESRWITGDHRLASTLKGATGLPRP